ncbi:hypothetical protein Kpol_340p8 [Vanderwaltozyma polyspora DSM 70294]|uniref:Nonsense-mediated mRNA decay factor n=1 Tax=Vanderwaltozyma polyspora (strain ATCC 22028 / DSM 70294 / BCRC 21397 / CBS 2163 / NBRC 10782 / NRRL Y-8283 / UCD 57-17) TaxID=436907 RepID=A7TSV3_VANPO|nr:uncharacterized protein Kpol_340p8 [Vanderwaltozyma polyspora DSM 70294]EDO14661.1 hypothetical protein Kpol_340p8 [Vanderwaltozyma polyspora DSM 70294]
MSSLTNSENYIQRLLTDFQKQLQPILESNRIIQDYTLLNGYINFVHSKVYRLIFNILEDEKTNIGSNDHLNFDSNVISNILIVLWEKIQYPIFKWFQAWQKCLLPKSKDEKPKYVEFRQMNSKVTKFFKSVHSFYYDIIENIHSQYDLSQVISNSIFKNLNLTDKNQIKNTEKYKLDQNNKLGVLLVVTLHRCILYIGSSQKYKTISDKISNKYVIDDFKKSIRYFDMASLILPSVGETYLQKGMILISTENYGIASYEFIRSILSRIPNLAGFSNLTKLLCDDKSSLRKRFESILLDTHNKDILSTRIVDKEITEYYFLALFSNKFTKCIQKDIPQNTDDTLLDGRLKLNHIELALYERISTKYMKNIHTIFVSLLTVIGGYEIISLNNTNSNDQLRIKKISLDEISEKQLAYLKFAFDLISHIFNNVIAKGWENNLEKYEYLAMVRIVICWIKSNKSVIQYSHRNRKFCDSFVNLLNNFLSSKKFTEMTIPDVRPGRAYFFQEDIFLKEFSPIKYALADFNDTAIFSKLDSPNRLVGEVEISEKLNNNDETELRLQSILYSGSKFFRKNSFNVEWIPSKNSFSTIEPMKEEPKSKMKPYKKSNFITEKKNKGNSKSASSRVLSLTELENQIINSRGTSTTEQRGYSGSSLPMAPSSFIVKPSSSLTTDKSSHHKDDTDSSLGSNRLSLSTRSNDSISSKDEGVSEDKEEIQKVETIPSSSDASPKLLRNIEKINVPENPQQPKSNNENTIQQDTQIQDSLPKFTGFQNSYPYATPNVNNTINSMQLEGKYSQLPISSCPFPQQNGFNPVDATKYPPVQTNTDYQGNPIQNLPSQPVANRDSNYNQLMGVPGEFFANRGGYPAPIQYMNGSYFSYQQQVTTSQYGAPPGWTQPQRFVPPPHSLPNHPQQQQQQQQQQQIQYTQEYTRMNTQQQMQSWQSYKNTQF